MNRKFETFCTRKEETILEVEDYRWAGGSPKNKTEYREREGDKKEGKNRKIKQFTNRIAIEGYNQIG